MIYFSYLVCLTLVANASSPSNMEIREDKKYTRLSRVSHLAAPNKIQEWCLGTAVVFRSKLKERRKQPGGGGGDSERERESQTHLLCLESHQFQFVQPLQSGDHVLLSPLQFCWYSNNNNQKNCTLHFVRRSNNTIHPDYYWLLIWKKMWWNEVVCTTTSFLPPFLPPFLPSFLLG